MGLMALLYSSNIMALRVSKIIAVKDNNAKNIFSFFFPPGGIKCPVCSFVYGTKWEFNRHLKNKHGLKLIEQDGETKWEVKIKLPQLCPNISKISAEV